MGLFSSIKKGLSKAWSSTKKAVKGIARSVKKVAKKVAYAVPGGKALWDLSSKIGKGVMKGIGKISAKLGPVGMMALSFVLAPVMGPMISSLWSGFGAGAAAMATSANAFVSTLGSVGSGVFATGNFIGGTLGAMGNAITESASNVMAGNFSGAASSFATNMSNAFTGKAGMAAVNSGAMQAATTAAADLSAMGGSARQVNMLTDSAAGSLQSLEGMGQLGADTIAGMDPQTLARSSNTVDSLQQGVEMRLDGAGNMSPVNNNQWLDDLSGDLSGQGAGNVNTYGDVLDATSAASGKAGISNGVLRNTIDNAYAGNTAFKGLTNAPANGSKALEKLKQVKSLLGGGGTEGGYQQYTPRAIQSQTVSNAGTARGQGSAGFSLLGGVQGLEQSVRNSQNMMFG
jgi:hypothetical protein